MKNLFDASTATEIENRLVRLAPDSKRQWGKMAPAQMLAHCNEWMDMAAGRSTPPRSILGYIFGRLAKRGMLNDRPVRHNMPTDKTLIVDEKRNFAVERDRLRTAVDSFVKGGAAKCTTHPHSFFGPMTPQEWATMAYKHLDHHLRQFGV